MRFFFILIVTSLSFCGTTKHRTPTSDDEYKLSIRTGAEQTEKYIPLLQGKRVAVMANQTSIIGSTHLIDSLKKLNVNIIKVFGP
ncbi:MAG TPA: DUF1343 domain-containing protein, partial [Chitinophagaceae bacterium]|nr:DUF1343 domain-containing protein [Chitinophagaceae bacterium]